jgi:hypothetical protein
VSTPKHVDDLLLASIQDVQTAISANDSKASAALIVHGLLFTGLLELLVNLGGVYHRASSAQRIVALTLLFLALGAFLVSIYFILRALLPYRPVKVETALGEDCRGVFFPLRFLDHEDPYPLFTEALAELDRVGSITGELAAERLKLADILKYESNNTRRGYEFLRFEIVLTAVFLVVVATAVL